MHTRSPIPLPVKHCDGIHICITHRGGSRYYKPNSRKRRIIDYNAEIPFEKPPPIGFYDTSQDAPDDDRHNFKRLRREDVEGVRRDREEAVS